MNDISKSRSNWLCVVTNKKSEASCQENFFIWVARLGVQSDCQGQHSLEPQLRIRQMARKVETSGATAKHMKSQLEGQLQAQVNPFRHQRANLPLHKNKARRGSKYTTLTNHKQAQVSQKKAVCHQPKGSSSNHTLSGFTTTAIMTITDSHQTTLHMEIPNTGQNSSVPQAYINIKLQKV